jgi:hypothetical protein
MPSSAGPNTAGESNLVFAYDTGDIINSYKGEPTVNLATTLDLYPQGGSLTLQTSTPGNVYLTNNAGANLNGQPFYLQVTTPSTYNNGGFTSSTNFNLPGGSTYLWLSFYVYLAQTYSGGNGPLGGYIAFKNSGGTEIGTSGWTFFINGVQNQNWSGDSANIGRWIRIDARSSITGGASGVTRWYVYNDLLTQGKMYVAQIQFTQNDRPVQYVNGTRSVTQGLVSLANNYTVDLTNASYDSNAQISLDGSNDYIKVAQNANFYTNDWTWEMVVKFTSNTGTYQGLVWAEGDTGGGSGLQYLLTLVNNTYLHYRIYNTTTGWANTDTANITFNPLLYNHIVWQFTNGTTKIYINGTLFHTNTSRGPYSGGSNSPMFLGARNDGSYGAPIIPTLYKFYNQALTATQIAQNYQAYKSRFNLA